jgi:hypothetical protein
MVTLEAFAYGLPQVCYDLPYLELWRYNKGLEAVSYGDKNAVADAIVSILDDPKKLERMQREARETAAYFAAIDHRQLWDNLIRNLTGATESSGHDIWGKTIDEIMLAEDHAQTMQILIQTYARCLKELK